MQAGSLSLRWSTVQWMTNPKPAASLRRFVRASSTSKGELKVSKPRKDWVAEWVSNNDDAVRSLPIYGGGASLLAVLFNRTVSGIAPVSDASSSQSRADLLALGLAVTNILTGLVWLSIRPKSISVVSPQGVACREISTDQLPPSVVSELLWVWETLSSVTCCRSLVIVYEKSCFLQIGLAAECPDRKGEPLNVDVENLMQGSLYQGVTRSGAQNYLANLNLYPGKSELPFLPLNTQAVILQPLGDKGIIILGGDMIRGFTTSDQVVVLAWITLIGEKIDASLAELVENSPLEVQSRN